MIFSQRIIHLLLTDKIKHSYTFKIAKKFRKHRRLIFCL